MDGQRRARHVNDHVFPVCPWCLSPQPAVFVNGHYQCPECKQVLQTCGEGEGDPDG